MSIYLLYKIKKKEKEKTFSRIQFTLLLLLPT